jgi:hypothetical protein
MELLKKNEQIYIENVDQLINVYRLLKNKWDNNYSLINEIMDFQKDNLTYVRGQGQGYPICLGGEDPNYITITYDDFISQVEKPPIPTPTIIESIDGKKYKAIILEEIKEPPTFWQWAKQHNRVNASSENIEDYVQYRINLKN